MLELLIAMNFIYTIVINVMLFTTAICVAVICINAFFEDDESSDEDKFFKEFMEGEEYRKECRRIDSMLH